MLFPVAGSKLFIRQGSSWTGIRSAESFGSLGFRWDLIDLTQNHDDGKARFMKGTMAPSPMQIVLAVDPEDAGQLALWQSARGLEASKFRLEFADGVTWREWEALVVGISETFDEANSVVKLLVELQVSSEIQRSEDSP